MNSLVPPAPITAIRSNLITRATLAIPPSPVSYDPLLKHVLRHRLHNQVLLRSAALSFTLTLGWTAWSKGAVGLGRTLALPFMPSTLLSGVVQWVLSVLPAIVLRKASLTATRTPATSPSSLMKNALAAVWARSAIATYIVAALLAVFGHLVVSFSQKDPVLSIFVRSKKHPYYLNGHLLFVLLSQGVVALGYAFRNILLDRAVFKWPHLKQHQPSSSHIVASIAISAALTTVSLPIAAFLFASARLILPIIYRLPLIPLILRPFTAHFLKGRWTIFLPMYHLPLFVRTWFMGFTTIFAWDMSESLFEAIICKPICISQMSNDPNLALVSGITSTEGPFSYFAYTEIHGIASDDSSLASARRTALFGDQKCAASLWSHILRESLLILGRDYQLLLRRGKPDLAATVASPKTASPPVDDIPARRVSLNRTSIYTHASPGMKPVEAALNHPSSDGPRKSSMEAGAEAAQVPEIFRSVEATVLPPMHEEAIKTIAEPCGIIAQIRSAVQESVGAAVVGCAPVPVLALGQALAGWWTGERIDRVVDTCLPCRELDAVVIEVLSYLVCASLTEDRYGVVQRDIPKILEAMLSFLAAIEEYQVEINGIYMNHINENTMTVEKREAVRLEVEKAGAILGVVGDALKEGVARIVRTFKDKLLAYKFPPRTAQKLQGFLDYC